MSVLGPTSLVKVTSQMTSVRWISHTNLNRSQLCDSVTYTWPISRGTNLRYASQHCVSMCGQQVQQEPEAGQDFPLLVSQSARTQRLAHNSSHTGPPTEREHNGYVNTLQVTDCTYIINFRIISNIRGKVNQVLCASVLVKCFVRVF
jgi:hypothetical protein